MSQNSMSAKKEGTPVTAGTTISVLTLGVEEMLTTAGPEQQQKTQKQHDATKKGTPAM